MKIEKFNERIIEHKPKVGDYVICKEIQADEYEEDMIKTHNFVYSHVGRCIQDDTQQENNTNLSSYPYHIKYENIPISISSNFRYGTRVMCLDEIIYFSNNKEELELKLSTNKFNI